MSLSNLKLNNYNLNNSFNNSVNLDHIKNYVDMAGMKGKDLFNLLVNGEADAIEYTSPEGIETGIIIDKVVCGADGYYYINPKAVYNLEKGGEVGMWRLFDYSIFVDTDGKLTIYEIYKNSDDIPEYSNPVIVNRVRRLS